MKNVVQFLPYDTERLKIEIVMNATENDRTGTAALKHSLREVVSYKGRNCKIVGVDPNSPHPCGLKKWDYILEDVNNKEEFRVFEKDLENPE